MSIRLRNGYEVVRSEATDEVGVPVPRSERMISVKHPEGGAYTYTRQPKAAPLDFLTVPADRRGKGRGQELLDHFARHLDHRGLPSKLEVAPLERGITREGLARLYASRGWKGASKVMTRPARPIAR